MGLRARYASHKLRDFPSPKFRSSPRVRVGTFLFSGPLRVPIRSSVTCRESDEWERSELAKGGEKSVERSDACVQKFGTERSSLLERSDQRPLLLPTYDARTLKSGALTCKIAVAASQFERVCLVGGYGLSKGKRFFVYPFAQARSSSENTSFQA